ncbi:protein of unknown function [Taphrina deformans PYCC 5710]|uniref:Store-operated calcium entry-associated regulatory factor n=1 Tax=Taphrina deformans (strain PYCC 5710 / ATCC 11124 / CBS 356.35 / IMI 108563 / JCM 9778 / NBRC 8474) TaxID=1097556 RepID=R4XF37_TAPDE|nr:protein of unknown function [Taphrina deformans PYCC 5710]|eukprot:CCG84258.1 protein of unknown function [Taphrina deformans PYCC 5710]
MKIFFTVSALTALVSTTTAAAAAAENGQAGAGQSFLPMSLADPQTLTFTADAETTGHSPVPQLACVGGNAATLYRVRNMTCTSLGPITALGHEEVHWKCTALVPPEFTLGETTVRCEPVPGPMDAAGDADAGEAKSPADGSFSQYVVDGSCAVEYTLHLSDLGEGTVGGRDLPQSPATDLPSTTGSGSGIAGKLFWVAFVGVATFIAYSIFFNGSGPGTNRGGRRGDGRNGRGDGPGHGGGGDAPGPSSSGDSDWTPISPHSTLYTPPSGLSSRSPGSLERPSVTARTDSSVAPPIVGDDGSRYGPAREVTSFGGTTAR